MDDPQGVVVLQEGAALPENEPLQVAEPAPVEEHPAEVAAVEEPHADPTENNASSNTEADCLCCKRIRYGAQVSFRLLSNL